MAVRIATSDPQPSAKCPGYWMFYFNKKTKNGSECVAVIPESLADIVRKNFVFDDDVLRWDSALGASVLSLDFDGEPSSPEPALPADPEAGWGDPDHLAAAIPSPEPEPEPEPIPAAVPPPAQIPNRGVRPQTARKHNAQVTGTALPSALLRTIKDVCATYNTAVALITPSTPDSFRYVTAQKLTAIASIPYYRQQGIALTEDDIDSFIH